MGRRNMTGQALLQPISFKSGGLPGFISCKVCLSLRELNPYNRFIAPLKPESVCLTEVERTVFWDTGMT